VICLVLIPSAMGTVVTVAQFEYHDLQTGLTSRC
jgi:hypothetical protein